MPLPTKQPRRVSVQANADAQVFAGARLASFCGLASALLFGLYQMILESVLRGLSESLPADPAAAFVVGLVIFVLLVLASDDDLPGPRRCFARGRAHAAP